jgi:hypothetical protein
MNTGCDGVMTMEVMVFALWVAALFLVLWQIIISIQFSRMSASFKTTELDFEEGWNFRDMERLFKTMASEIVNEKKIYPDCALDAISVRFEESLENSLPDDEYLSVNEYLSANQYAASEKEIEVDTENYLNYLEGRIDSLESLIAERMTKYSISGGTANMSAGHLGPYMTQYGQEFSNSNEYEYIDDHYTHPKKVAVNDWSTPVRLRRVR